MTQPSAWTLVFDLDGTLVETAPDLHAALNETLLSVDLKPVPLETIRMMIGDGAKALIQKGLAFNDKSVDAYDIDDQLWPFFLDHYLANICNLSEPFPHAEEALTRFQTVGFNMAVCTNKAQHLAEEVLKGLNLAAFFSATLGGDTARSKKPDGSHIADTITLAKGQLTRALMVGDSVTDEKAARNAGLPFVFFTEGYGQLQDPNHPDLKITRDWLEIEAAIQDLTSKT